jgi:hypothetical protein
MKSTATTSLAIAFLMIFILACTCGNLDKKDSSSDDSKNSSLSNIKMSNTKDDSKSSTNTKTTDDTTRKKTSDVSIKDMYLAKDNNDKAGSKVGGFSVSDNPIHIVVTLNKPKDGTNVKMTLFAVDAQGIRKNSEVVSTDITMEKNQTVADFQASLKTDWPTGTYRFDIFIDGEKAGDKEFEIQ